MADDSGGEKTEDASGRKLDKAREEGIVGKSQEVPAVFVLLAGVVTLNSFAYFMYNKTLAVMRDSLVFDSIPNASVEFFVKLFYRYSEAMLLIMSPVLAAVFFAALATNFFQVGIVLSWKAIEPKFSKLNPIKGFSQKFSSRAVVELLKSIAKIVIVALVTYYAVLGEMNNILNLYGCSIGYIMLYIMKIAFRIFIRVLIVMVFLALTDFAFQKWKFAQDQKMTKQEVKDENKQTDGDPQIKSRIRQVQMEAARKRMMSDIPQADVVVTNPTHLAVAIKYDALGMDAPKIVAKGAGAVAENIKKIAGENQIPVIENKKLARSLYKSVEIGEYVPADFYQAVAELLAYVYNLKGKSV